jgi:hypothetical protein
VHAPNEATQDGHSGNSVRANSEVPNGPNPQPARRYSKTPKSEIQAVPTQLGFYPSRWCDVLELAKLKFRCWLVCQNAFPSRRLHLQHEASECVTEALAEYQGKEHLVESGKSLSMQSHLLLLMSSSSEGYWPQHKDDMAIVVSAHAVHRGHSH